MRKKLDTIIFLVGLDFGQSTVYTVNDEIINRFEICPLHNSVQSLIGSRPDAFDILGTTMGIFFGINLMFNAKEFYKHNKELKGKF